MGWCCLSSTPPGNFFHLSHQLRGAKRGNTRIVVHFTTCTVRCFWMKNAFFSQISGHLCILAIFTMKEGPHAFSTFTTCGGVNYLSDEPIKLILTHQPTKLLRYSHGCFHVFLSFLVKNAVNVHFSPSKTYFFGKTVKHFI